MLPIQDKPKKESLKTFESNDLNGLGKIDDEIKCYVNLTNIQTYKKSNKNDISIYDQIIAKNKMFKFETIFMGKRKFKPSVVVEADYLNKKFILHMNHPIDDLIYTYMDNSIAIESIDIENEISSRECIPFYAINEMKLAIFEDSDMGIVLIKVNEGTPFKTVVCGIGRCLNPNVDDDYNPAKYIIFSGDIENAIFFYQSFHNNINDLKIQKIPKTFKKLLNHLKKLAQDDSNDKFIEEEALRELKQHNKSCKRQERDAYRYEKEKIFDPDDEIIYLVYPIQEDAVDAVTIYNGCLKKLKEPEYLNDNLIDWKIKFDINNKVIEDDSIRNRIHAFNTLFFTKLTEVKDHQRGFELVKKWTQHVDIFEKDFVLVPVNKDLHWSLIIIARLNLLKPNEEEKENMTDIDGPEFLQDMDDDNRSVACILHMDSLSPYGHSGEEFAKILRLYLQHEWKAKKGTKLECTVNKLPFHKCSGPTQDNSYDCGVFVIKYVEYILDHINDINPTKKSLKNRRFSKDDNVITDNAFSQENVTIERVKMRSYLDRIHNDWKLEMEKIRQQKFDNGVLEDEDYLEIQTQSYIQEKIQEKKDIERALDLSEENAQISKAISASLHDSQGTEISDIHTQSSTQVKKETETEISDTHIQSSIQEKKDTETEISMNIEESPVNDNIELRLKKKLKEIFRFN